MKAMTEELTNLHWLSDRPATRFTVPGQTDLCSEPNSLLIQMNGTPLPPCFAQSEEQSEEYSSQAASHTSSFAKGIADPVSSARPNCSYSCLIAMALKASRTGALLVSEIYRFIE